MINSTHRQARKMPSLKKHGLSAVLLLALIGLSTYSWLHFAGKRVNTHKFRGQEIALPKTQAPLNTAAIALPDLLEDDNIPMDENPTESLDLLGAPKTTPQVPKILPKAVTPKITVKDGTGSGANIPQTILIDGKPLGGGATYSLNAVPLTRAPIQGLTRMSPFGRVPYRPADGRTVLSAYAKPFTPAPGTSYISLVIGGLGMNGALTKRAINELPGDISLAFAAEAPNLQTWINQARAKGHEVLIELPMQGRTEKSSAIHTLTSAREDSVNIKNLDYLLSRAEGYFAATNYDGDVLVNQEKALKPILSHIHNAGLGFLYDGASAGALISGIGKESGLAIVTANQLIDENTQARANVATAISTLNANPDQSIPIGMGFSYGGTIDGIKDWLDNKPKSTQLAPVSYALKANK